MGCALEKKNLPQPNVIINLDNLNITDGSKYADFLFASDECRGRIAAIEMKRGVPNISECIQQLQGAATIAEGWVSPSHVENFHAIIASGKMPKYQLTVLRKRSSIIRFQNKDYPITPVRCNSNLKQAFNRKFT